MFKNKGLKNEVAFLLGAMGLISLFRGRTKTASALGFASAALAVYDRAPGLRALTGKNVVITGGSRGLGFALAREVLFNGGNVALLARDQQELEEAKEKLATLNSRGDILVMKCDVTQKSEVEQTFALIKKYWLNQIDILINNAGTMIVGPFESMKEEDYRAQMDLHLFAVLHTTKEVLPYFKSRGGGRIVNICSLGGKAAVPHMLPYDVSKFALAGFSQGVAAEFDRYGISVTTAYPTVMKTGSPIQAVFKGDARSEFEWFAMGDYTPGFTVPADKAARSILEAALANRSEVVLSLSGRARILMGSLFPELMMWGMGIMNRLLPRGQSSEMYLTGAEARDPDGAFVKVFGEEARRTEAELNQRPKSNAKESLGVNPATSTRH